MALQSLRPERYFDHAATTPLDPDVRRAMLPYLDEAFGNAHSIHSRGIGCRHAVERAREQVAAAVGAEPETVVFTSGATEADNWVVAAHATGIVSPFEHSAVREPALAKGFVLCPNEGLGLVASDGESYDLQSILAVNNEIGTILDPAQPIGGRLRHSDATQALGKRPVDATSVEFLTLSSHKAYGPQGVGALIVRAWIQPGQLGGEQENGLRAGTLPVAGIVGFGEAARIAAQRWEEDEAHVRRLRETVLNELDRLSDVRVHGDGAQGVPHILSVAFYGLAGETLAIEMDHAGFAISAGAACSSRSTEPSHVLSALGIEEGWLRGTVRISFGRGNTSDSAAELAKALVRSVQSLRALPL